MLRGNFARSKPDSAVGERTLNLERELNSHDGRVKQSLRAGAHLTAASSVTKMIADRFPSLVIEPHHDAGEKKTPTPADSRRILHQPVHPMAQRKAIYPTLDKARASFRKSAPDHREDGIPEGDLRTTESLSQFIDGERPDARPRCNCFSPLTTLIQSRRFPRNPVPPRK
jgi:hypothetical protein